MDGRSPVPITLVSGFLGAGKTTLVKAVLKNKACLKCAVLVNDMASINVDAAIINKSNTLKDDDAMVHFENGCVCCDLNDELLGQVVALAKTGEYDNMIIEITGVAEPDPVVDSLAGEAGVREDVKEAARLDTCVTVVDCSMFFSHLHSDKRLRDTELAEGVDAAETEGMTSQLLVSQVEFADVILLNKTDLLAEKDRQTVEATMKKLNPRARVICCSFSQVDVADVLSTSRFSEREPEEKVHAKPEQKSGGDKDTEADKLEDAVTSFVYTARMPFHPARLHAFATRYFQLHQQDWRGSLAASAPDRAADQLGRSAAAVAAAAAALPQRGGAALAAAQLAAGATRHAAALAAAVAAAGSDSPSDGDSETPLPAPPADPAPPAASSKERTAEVGTILRSKGFIWLAGASRNDHCAQWSSAGEVLQLSTDGLWFAALPEETWPEDVGKRDEILNDFLPGIGDRRQELVFIGLGLNEGAIRAALDAALATPLELLPDPSPSALCSTHPCPQLDASVDPFAAWPPNSEFLAEVDASDDDDDDDESGSDEEEEANEKEANEEEADEEGSAGGSAGSGRSAGTAGGMSVKALDAAYDDAVAEMQLEDVSGRSEDAVATPDGASGGVGVKRGRQEEEDSAAAVGMGHAVAAKKGRPAVPVGHVEKKLRRGK